MKLKFLGILLLVIFLCSCAQLSDLWVNHKYEERITHILRTEDGTKIVVIGEKYHYVFLNQHSLSELLAWDGIGMLEFKFNENFHINQNSEVTGDYSVICNCRSANLDQINWLESNGFHQDKKMKSIFFNKYTVTGAIYLSNNTDLSKYKKVKNDYKIIVESRYPFDTLAKIAFTPVAIYIDVSQAVIYGSALVIASPFYVLGDQNDEDK